MLATILEALLPAALNLAESLIAVRSHADPTVSNAALNNVAAATTLVTALVPKVDAIATAAAAAGTPMTGAQKLDTFHQIVDTVIPTLAPVATGGLANTIAQDWPLIDTIIAQVCAAAHAISGTNIPGITSGNAPGQGTTVAST